MNEIIAKLDEIEEKANAIISDAKERKEQMMQQLNVEKAEIDAKYDRMETEHIKNLEQKFRNEADHQIERLREEQQKALETLDRTFAAEKEQMAEEIFERMTV